MMEIGITEILLGLAVLDRILEEIPKEAPIIGKYKGILRPIVQAVLRVGKKKG